MNSECTNCLCHTVTRKRTGSFFSQNHVYASLVTIANHRLNNQVACEIVCTARVPLLHLGLEYINDGQDRERRASGFFIPKSLTTFI
jgi:hypothetical protein